MTQKSIEDIAKEVRDSNEDWDFTALCLDYSRELQKKLVANGYNAIVVQGTYLVDEPNISYTDESLEDLDEEEQDTARHNPLHYWVEVDGTIVDITADQFSDEVIYDEIPPITIGSYEDYPRYIPIHKDWR